MMMMIINDDDDDDDDDELGQIDDPFRFIAMQGIVDMIEVRRKRERQRGGEATRI